MVTYNERNTKWYKNEARGIMQKKKKVLRGVPSPADWG